MRKEFTITIVKEDDKGNQTERSYKVTDNLAARSIIDARLGGVTSIIEKHAPKRFMTINVTELTCITYALIKGGGYDVTEEEIGETIVDIGEIAALQLVLPVIEYWVDKMNSALGISKKKPASTSRARRTRSP
jgi:hypothetical protein